MNKFEILQEVIQGKRGKASAAALLVLSERGLDLALRRYAPHLPQILAAYAAMRSAATKREQTQAKEELAQTLNVTYNQVNRLLRMGGMDVPPPKVVENRVKTRENAQKRRKTIQKMVKQVALGVISEETAQKDLQMSSRQFARYLSKFTHDLGFAVPDWKKLPRAEREEAVRGRE